MAGYIGNQVTPQNTPSSQVVSNLLVNPNFGIDQINNGALYTVTGGAAATQALDGWSGQGGAAPGVFKLRQLADPDNAALKCMEITCTTIDAAIGVADYYKIYTAVEGYDAATLMWGTAFAQSATLLFNFKTSVTGVYGIAVTNSAGNRSYVAIITVADTAEHTYTITIPGDTAGTWLYTNGIGLYFQITLACGSDNQKAAGAWGADNKLTTSAQCNFMSNIANIAYLKRIQLVPGTAATNFAPQDYRSELARCMRYYQSAPLSFATGAVGGNVQFSGLWPVPMRASPTQGGTSGTAIGVSATGYTVSVPPAGTAVVATLNSRLA